MMNIEILYLSFVVSVTDIKIKIYPDSLISCGFRLDGFCFKHDSVWRNVSTTLRQPAFEFKLGFVAVGLAG